MSVGKTNEAKEFNKIFYKLLSLDSSFLKPLHSLLYGSISGVAIGSFLPDFYGMSDIHMLFPLIRLESFNYYLY